MVLGLFSKKPPEGIETLGGFNLVPSEWSWSWLSPGSCGFLDC